MLAPCARRTLNAAPLPVTFSRGLRNPGKGRTVQVQLTTDVPPLGNSGAVLDVNRGFMRNYLYPQRKANYMTREVGPQLLNGPDIAPVRRANSAQHEQWLMAASSSHKDVVQNLRELPAIVFNRRLRTMTAIASLANHAPIRGMAILGNGIKLSDVRSRLAALGFSGLDPPYAVLELTEGRRKLRGLGKFGAQIRFLGYEEPVRLTISVEPEKEKGDDDSAQTVAPVPKA
ncbi:hypothetical protein BKA62DRAFT_346772 [Auriculariales sp. MPI-PUGE-AT-0066]|nr:hypothetical protein BKA62DRAFT_346772 [Auriculariales sp. MPI-PUGE-AT-0066]